MKLKALFLNRASNPSLRRKDNKYVKLVESIYKNFLLTNFQFNEIKSNSDNVNVD